ncbi:MAG: tetratricopeptide repeat protein [Candidatus Omnitrophota bacterium]
MKKLVVLIIIITIAAYAGAAETTRKDELRKLLAETEMSGGDYEKAIELYREILKDNPADIKTRTSLADVLSWNKEYDNSIDEYKKVLESDPGDLFALKKLAEVYSWKKDYLNAEKIYKQIIEKNPDDTETYTALGEILVWQKRYEEANGYFMKALKGKEPIKAKLLYGRTLLYAGQFAPAEDVFNEILREYPKNNEAKMFLADTYAYSKRFKKAIILYREILTGNDNPEIKEKLADVLSWDKQYNEAFVLYDEILAQKYKIKVQVQKARVLGWDKQYGKSLKEYKNAVLRSDDESVELEMKAKKAIWSHRIETAINDYKKLVKMEPDNLEAAFDLSQVYSYQSMWPEARKEYRKILEESPSHFRAAEGLKKTELMSKHLSWKMGYKFFEADSPSRDMDIKENQLFNNITIPMADNVQLDIDYLLTGRVFRDFHDLLENKGRFKIVYKNMPGFSASGYYGLLHYNKDVEEYTHIFGGNVSSRVFDAGTFDFSFDREELDNTSLVIRKHEYRNNFKPRVDINLNRDCKIGADYLYSHYSDDNFKHEGAFDALCYLSPDPLRFTAKYRYFYRQFKTKVKDYFSPKGFSTHAFGFNWRHYLNKDEIFYGANDLYYDFKYDISIDSTYVVGHKFTWGFNWDLNKRLNFNVQGFVMGSSANVYNEKNVTASIKYYF